jgi:hypothetical protein
MERLVFCHSGKFALRDECSGRAIRGIDGRLVQLGRVGQDCLAFGDVPGVAEWSFQDGAVRRSLRRSNPALRK